MKSKPRVYNVDDTSSEAATIGRRTNKLDSDYFAKTQYLRC